VETSNEWGLAWRGLEPEWRQKMNERQKMTFEEMEAILDEICGPKPKPKPKVIANEGEVVRDAEVQVSPKDPNYRGSEEGVVRVRRNDFVTINMELWEAQQEAKREDRRLRRRLDPFRLGHWDDPDE
jgi:hypothetical protein